MHFCMVPCPTEHVAFCTHIVRDIYCASGVSAEHLCVLVKRTQKHELWCKTREENFLQHMKTRLLTHPQKEASLMDPDRLAHMLVHGATAGVVRHWISFVHQSIAVRDDVHK
jgi:hypothetical protein